MRGSHAPFAVRTAGLHEILVEKKDEDGNVITENDCSERQVIKYERLEDFGGAINAYAYEYTYSYNGESYYVYQVIAIDGWVMNYKGYVFTYVTNIENKEAHAEELQKILSKVDFE